MTGWQPALDEDEPNAWSVDATLHVSMCGTCLQSWTSGLDARDVAWANALAGLHALEAHDIDPWALIHSLYLRPIPHQEQPVCEP